MSGSGLTSADLEKLSACGIDAELAEQSQLRRVDSAEGSGLIGRNGAGDYAGILFPYVWPGEERVREYRLRRDSPELEQKPDGTVRERGKYLSPPGRGNMLYFAPGTQPEWLQDTTLPVTITEGEKKTLALWRLGWHNRDDATEQPRFLPAGLPGVWNWRGTVGKAPGPDGGRRDVKGPIPDLDRLGWNGRRVTIVFDVNAQTNDSVQHARRGLARELGRRGANVSVVDLPDDVPGVNGVDDLVGQWGPDRVLKLLENPRPVDDVSDDRPRVIHRIEDVWPISKFGDLRVTWAVYEMLAESTVNVWTGEPGCGKTTLAAYLAYCVSRGEPFAGRGTVQRPVLVLDRESPRSVMVHILRRLGIYDDPPQFTIWGGWERDDPPDPSGAVVLDWISRCDPKPLIVLDSLVAFQEGSENDAREMRTFLHRLRKIANSGAVILALHHVGKSETAKLYRGSSDIPAGIDLGLKISNHSDDPARLDRLGLKPFKDRLGCFGNTTLIYNGENGFRELQSDGESAVTSDRLRTLLGQNPRVTAREFEALATEQNIGRNEARRWLERGRESGIVWVEQGPNRSKIHALAASDSEGDFLV